MQLCLICFFLISSWQEAGVQEALGKLLTTEHMSSSMKLLTLQGWYLVKFGEHMYMYMYLCSLCSLSMSLIQDFL